MTRNKYEVVSNYSDEVFNKIWRGSNVTICDATKNKCRYWLNGYKINDEVLEYLISNSHYHVGVNTDELSYYDKNELAHDLINTYISNVDVLRKALVMVNNY